MASDIKAGTLMLFGGSRWAGSATDTWVFTPPPEGSFTTFGQGCIGSRGTPTIGLPFTSSSGPQSGEQFIVQVKNLPLVGSAWMFLGASNTNYGATPLPLDLTPIGMNGCSLLVSAESLFPMNNVLGIAAWSVLIPPGLEGQSFHQQAFVFDASANPFGAIVSNAATATIGF